MDRMPEVSSIEIAPEDPAHPDARRCIAAYLAELTRRDSSFDPATSRRADDEDLRPPAGVLLLARFGAEAVGCVAVTFHGHGPAEVKRMWVAPSARGEGVGRRLLLEVERHARQHGVRVLRLETNRALVEAIRLYRSAGYREVPAFNDEPFAHHWFHKHLDPRG